MNDIDDVLEMVVNLIFDARVDLDGPKKTLEQLKSILNNEGLYRYPKNK